VHIDQPLTNLTLAYVQSQENFIADKVFPTIGVQKQSDKYYIYDRDNMNRTGDVQKLAPRTEVNRIGMSLVEQLVLCRCVWSGYGLRSADPC
jgi:hypothetical protein